MMRTWNYLFFSFLLFSCSVTGHFIDPDTPEEFLTTKSLVDGRKYVLVASDEFSNDGRTYVLSADPMWTAVDHSDDANTGGALALGSQQYYNSSMVTTKNGFLNITTTSEETKWRGWNPYKKQYVTLQKTFRSGMISSWNKFCFTGGKVEIRARLPGKGDIGGLWPAIWMLGNLGKPTYEASTNLIWPWSYNKCDLDKIEAQEISACRRTHHFGMPAGTGRGSTEIDILEAMAGTLKHLANTEMSMPYFSSTLQLAPGIADNRPNFGIPPQPWQTWYTNMTYGTNSSINVFFYGSNLGETAIVEPTMRTAKQSYRADSVSSINNIDNSYFDEFHTYGLEWVTGKDGYINWYADDVQVFGVTAEGISVNGAQIPEEPSYLIFNTAVSSSWGFPLPCPDGCDCSCFDCNKEECVCGLPVGFCDILPAHFLIDHVRIWQAENDSTQYTGCDPVSHPTRRFMQGHKDRYVNKPSEKLTYPTKEGGGKCFEGDCGVHGTCVPILPSSSLSSFSILNKCQCESGWVGPNCLVSKKWDENPTSWEVGNSMEYHRIALPTHFYLLLTALLAGALVSTIFVVSEKQRNRPQPPRRGMR
jgi:beta-glucanase (GH16 family)